MTMLGLPVLPAQIAVSTHQRIRLELDLDPLAASQLAEAIDYARETVQGQEGGEPLIYHDGLALLLDIGNAIRAERVAGMVAAVILPGRS